MTNFEIQLFTHYPTLTKIWKASDGAYFVKLRDAQAYSQTLPDNNFVEIARPSNLPPLPADPAPVNTEWVEFPYLWQWRGDFVIEPTETLIVAPQQSVKMWVLRITSNDSNLKTSTLRWDSGSNATLVVGVGDYIMCTGTKWEKLFDLKKITDIEATVTALRDATIASNNATVVQMTALRDATIASNNSVLTASANLTALQVSSNVFSSPTITRFLFGNQSNTGEFAQFSGLVRAKGGLLTNRIDVVDNYATIRLEAASSSGYYCEIKNQYDGTEPFFINSGGEKILGRMVIANSQLQTYVNGYQSFALTTGVFSPNSSNIRLYVNSEGNVLINSVTDEGWRLDINGTFRTRSKARFDGSVEKKTRTIEGSTGTYTINTDDYTVIIDRLGSGSTVTLPSASANTGRELRLVNRTGSAVTIGTHKRYGTTDTTIGGSSAMMLQSDGTNWIQTAQ
jgi:hypothetical protein